MKVLVIGGTGFVGAQTVHRLNGDGHSVAVYHRGRTQATLPDGVQEFLNPNSSLANSQFPSAIFRFSPEVVIHTLAMTEADALNVVNAFAGRTGRLVVLSSGDVYRAYGRLMRLEHDEIDNEQLSESSPLRTVLFPYRGKAASENSFEYNYDKILVERSVLGGAGVPGSVVRLPKVYGPGSNADLATIYRYSHQPEWRWTHGYVANVAAAIAVVATHPLAAGVYNTGEESTPTVSQRLEFLPPSRIAPDLHSPLNFAQNIVYNTDRIRTELGYHDVFNERDAMLATLARNTT